MATQPMDPTRAESPANLGDSAGGSDAPSLSEAFDKLFDSGRQQAQAHLWQLQSSLQQAFGAMIIGIALAVVAAAALAAGVWMMLFGAASGLAENGLIPHWAVHLIVGALMVALLGGAIALRGSLVRRAFKREPDLTVGRTNGRSDSVAQAEGQTPFGKQVGVIHAALVREARHMASAPLRWFRTNATFALLVLATPLTLLLMMLWPRSAPKTIVQLYPSSAGGDVSEAAAAAAAATAAAVSPATKEVRKPVSDEWAVARDTIIRTTLAILTTKFLSGMNEEPSRDPANSETSGAGEGAPSPAPDEALPREESTA
ncbi:MAG: hypothetical protein SF069_08565 [Phycisphaerae bacterium]|nr:hypothetical protein [Phycisphaerae bacterium]